MLHIPQTNSCLLAATQEPYQKDNLSMKNTEEFSGRKVRRIGQWAQKREDRKSNGGRQKNKTGDSKVESNDSHGIPDRGKHQTTSVSLCGLLHSHFPLALRMIIKESFHCASNWSPLPHPPTYVCCPQQERPASPSCPVPPGWAEGHSLWVLRWHWPCCAGAPSCVVPNPGCRVVPPGGQGAARWRWMTAHTSVEPGTQQQHKSKALSSTFLVNSHISQRTAVKSSIVWHWSKLYRRALTRISAFNTGCRKLMNYFHTVSFTQLNTMFPFIPLCLFHQTNCSLSAYTTMDSFIKANGQRHYESMSWHLTQTIGLIIGSSCEGILLTKKMSSTKEPCLVPCINSSFMPNGTSNGKVWPEVSSIKLPCLIPFINISFTSNGTDDGKARPAVALLTSSLIYSGHAALWIRNDRLSTTYSASNVYILTIKAL